jgi:hypothetical protein
LLLYQEIRNIEHSHESPDHGKTRLWSAPNNTSPDVHQFKDAFLPMKTTDKDGVKCSFRQRLQAALTGFLSGVHVDTPLDHFDACPIAPGTYEAFNVRFGSHKDHIRPPVDRPDHGPLREPIEKTTQGLKSFVRTLAMPWRGRGKIKSGDPEGLGIHPFDKQSGDRVRPKIRRRINERISLKKTAMLQNKTDAKEKFFEKISKKSS